MPNIFRDWRGLALGAVLISCSPPPDPETFEETDGELTSGATYVIKAVHSGKCVDVYQSLTGSGANIQQWDCGSGKLNQQFKFTSTSTGYEIRPAHTTGQCVDVNGASLVNGGNVNDWSCNGKTNQRWKLLSTSTSGQYQIQAVHSGKCFDVAGASTLRGANIQQWTCYAKTNQRFTFTRVSSGGTGGSGGSTGGTGGSTGGTGGSGGSLTWRKANLTWFTSYPDPNSEECIKYNGCTWAGQFAFVSGTQSQSWVQSHNIAAIHEKDANTYKLKTLRLKQGTRQIDVKVYDMCSDSDCSGCCTENATQNGLNFLIDLEKYTKERFGSGSGIVDWACLDCN